MRKIYSPEDIRKVLDVALESNVDFIGSVGRACAKEVLRAAEDRSPKVVVFAGDDINGAYAIHTAMELHDKGCPADLYLINIGGNLLKPKTVEARQQFLLEVGEDYLYETVDFHLKMPEAAPDMIVVDGLFGREYDKPLRGGYQTLARQINELNATVISIDLPSGMTPSLAVGMVNQNIVHATLTLTLVGPSLAFFMPENHELIGTWKTLALPYPRDILRSIEHTAGLITAAQVQRSLPRRSIHATKNDLGTVLIYAGSYGMMGASVLAARGALRSGCGKVIVHGPRCGYYVMQTAVPCAMFDTKGGDRTIADFTSSVEADAIVVGPGIGTSIETVKALELLLKKCCGERQPLVIDADALNCIARHPAMLDFLPPGSILTPHAGEFDRIFGRQPSSSARLLKAIEIAAKYQVVIVLKSHYTQTVWPNGVVVVNTGATEALATPGSGDVLAGIIGSLMALRMKPEKAALSAVYIHGLAGSLAAKENGVWGVTAEDIASYAGDAIDLILNHQADNKK